MTKEEMRRDFDKDLQKYSGKPFKELLKDIDGKTRIYYTITTGVDFYGACAGSMMANQVAWHLADATVTIVSAADGKFHDIEVYLIVG